MRISDWSSDVCSSDLSAINAASMLMLAGRKAQARQMAQAALQKLKAADNEVERFYALATESEAALLLDDPTRCRKKLVAADRLLADDVTRRSRTRLQLRSEEHKSELQSLMRTSYAGFCLKQTK